MDLLEDPESEKSEEKKTDYSGVIIGAAMLPILFIFNHFGKWDEGLNVCICLGMNILAIRMRWDLRKHFWFWGIMVLVVAIELPLVLHIQWPHTWVPAVALLPIGLAGFLIAYAAIRLVEKFMVKDPPPDEDA